MRRWSCRVLTMLALLAPFSTTATAAQLGGVYLPDAVHIEGKTLVLNGVGQRLYSFLRVPIYVAGLYVQHPSTDANAILYSPEVKLLTIKFQHDVSAEDARTAWRDGFDDNCVAPCHLDPNAVSRFLAAVPAMHVGDVYTILFTPDGARVDAGQRPLGVIRLPRFARDLPGAAASIVPPLGGAAARSRLTRRCGESRHCRRNTWATTRSAPLLMTHQE